MVLMVEGVLIVIIAHENHGVGGISNIHGCCSFCVTLLGFIPALALEVCDAICFFLLEISKERMKIWIKCNYSTVVI